MQGNLVFRGLGMQLSGGPDTVNLLDPFVFLVLYLFAFLQPVYGPNTHEDVLTDEEHGL